VTTELSFDQYSVQAASTPEAAFLLMPMSLSHGRRLASTANQSQTHLSLRAQPVFAGTAQQDREQPIHGGRLVSTANQSQTHQSLRAQPVFAGTAKVGKGATIYV
jgi:hypothetical protein